MYLSNSICDLLANMTNQNTVTGTQVQTTFHQLTRRHQLTAAIEKTHNVSLNFQPGPVHLPGTCLQNSDNPFSVVVGYEIGL